MADPIAWGLEIINGQKTDKVQDTLDGLDFETPLENGLDKIQEAVNNAPVGGPLPFALDDDNFKAESVAEGIKLTYKATMNLDNASTDNNLCGTIAPYGIMIRYATDHYPRTPKDGLLAVDDTDIVDTSAKMVMGTSYGKQKSYTLVGLTSNQTYYFSAFPYSYYGMYNINSGMDGNTVVRANSQRTTCTWVGTAATLTVTITQDLDLLELGEITATLTPTSGGSALTQTRTGPGNVVFSNLTSGEYTLSFSAVTNFTTPSSQEITLAAGQPNTASAQYVVNAILENFSWEQINQYSQLKIANQLFEIHDKKSFSYNGETTITMEIVGFNHDNLVSGGKAGITWSMSGLVHERVMDSNDSYTGTFTGTDLYSWLTTTFYDGLPYDLKSVIKPVIKKTANKSGTGASIIDENMTLFLFSSDEVGVYSDSYNNRGEGSNYAGFASNDDRVRKTNNGTGTAKAWWLRSPSKVGPGTYCGVWTSGTSGATSVDSADVYVCVGFCI